MLLRRNKILISLVFAFGAMNANAQTFVPGKVPIFNNAQAKPNIHLVLDDSGSMRGNTYNEQVDMFNDNGDIIRVDRNVALEYAINKILLKYRDKAFLGTSLIYQQSRPAGNGQVHLLLDDYSKMTDKEFLDDYYAGLKAAIKASPGNTPIRPAVYDALKMFRGMPVSEKGNRSLYYSLSKSYKHEQLPSPLRYRCQQNHIIMMTDGEANTHMLVGIANTDKEAFGLNKSTNVGTVENGVDTGATISLTTVGPVLANIASTVDLRDWALKSSKDDITGNPWKDNNSRAMPITMHSVSLHVDPDNPLYTQMTKPTKGDTKGMNLGFGAKEPGNADTLLLAFDTIFASIIRSTSSTLAVTDRDLSTSREGMPGVTTDVSEMSTLHYDTIYNFRDKRGSLRANQTYYEKDNFTDPDKKNPVTKPAELWTTDATIKPNQGRFVTTPMVQDKQLKSLVELNSVEGKEALNKVYADAGHAVKNPGGINDSYIKWMMDYTYIDATNGLRGRLTPLGSVTNSDIVLANKDVLNINVNKDKMSKGLRNELVGYLKYKSKYQPTNLIVVGDNDGFISFINAQRGLSGSYKAGERHTAYFPKFQAAKIDDIAKANREAIIIQESRINLVDAKVNQPGLGDVYATIGLSSMGSGGKAIVGYRVYGETSSNVTNWNTNKTSPSHSGAGKLLSEVTPLFEIVNEEFTKTPGFEDLGYTYSGFEFFNREVDNAGVKQGQAVAIFGNGFGVEKSVVYFIDAYTGEKLHEIVLSPNGGGAASPTAIIEKDATGQKISYLYVGDYSGTMYRVKFGGTGFQDTDKTTVTALFQAPKTNYGQSAISVKPLVAAGAPGIYSVYFGTGVAASQDLDRGENSLVQHRIYGVFDRNIAESVSTTAKVSEMNKGKTTLTAALTVNNLTEANVKYKDSSKVDYTVVNKEHELDISVPSTQSEYGWSIKLIADGDASGERTIYNPVMDKKTSEVIFSTWGIIERPTESNLPAGSVYDPCIVDEGFGKSMYLALDTGAPSSKKGDNKGTTNTPSGSPEGRDIIAAPLGNETTDIADLSAAESEEVLENVGKDNSSYVQPSTDPNQMISSARCYLDNQGVRVCDGKDEGLQLLKKRVYMRTIF